MLYITINLQLSVVWVWHIFNLRDFFVMADVLYAVLIAVYQLVMSLNFLHILWGVCIWIKGWIVMLWSHLRFFFCWYKFACLIDLGEAGNHTLKPCDALLIFQTHFFELSILLFWKGLLKGLYKQSSQKTSSWLCYTIWLKQKQKNITFLVKNVNLWTSTRGKTSKDRYAWTLLRD